MGPPLPAYNRRIVTTGGRLAAWQTPREEVRRTPRTRNTGKNTNKTITKTQRVTLDLGGHLDVEGEEKYRFGNIAPRWATPRPPRVLNLGVSEALALRYAAPAVAPR